MFNQMVKYPAKTLDRTFAALADPTRRRILAHLARGSKRVTHLARPHAMSLPAVSKHLRVLEKAGLLRRRRYGRVHEMQLEAKPLKQAAQWVEDTANSGKDRSIAWPSIWRRRRNRQIRKAKPDVSVVRSECRCAGSKRDFRRKRGRFCREQIC